jgi:hypothetical protein
VTVLQRASVAIFAAVFVTLIPSGAAAGIVSSTTITYDTAPYPPVENSSVTLTIRVTGDQGTPTGTVNFSAGPFFTPAAKLCERVPLVAGEASCATSFSFGLNAAFASYSGDQTYAESFGRIEFVVRHAGMVALVTPNPGNGSGSLSASPPPDVTSYPTPIGNIEYPIGYFPLLFYAPRTVVLTATPNSFSTFAGWSGAGCSGTGSCAVNLAGDATVAATFTIARQPTTTTLYSSANPAAVGQVVAFTAAVNSAVNGYPFTPSGVVTFMEGTNTLCASVPLPASCQASALNVGSHSVTALYQGDEHFLASQSSPLSVQVNQGVRLTVTRNGPGTVMSDVPGIDCGSACSFEFPYLTKVTLTAIPVAGGRFLGWSNGCAGTNPTCTFTLGFPSSVTAYFDGPSPPAITSASSASFPVGSFVLFQLTGTGSPPPGFSISGALPPGVTFSSASAVLSGPLAPGAVGSYPLTITASNGFPPDATQAFTLNVTKASQTISFASLPNRTIGDAPFTVSATASSGLAVSFSTLTSATCSVSAASVTLLSVGVCTIGADQSGDANYLSAAQVTRSFAIGPTGTLALTVLKTGDGLGSVTSDVPGIDCGTSCSFNFSSGTVVTLSAHTTGGSTFRGWSGPCSGTAACPVTLNAATTVTAAFDASDVPRLVNISTRGKVLTGEDVMIGGFIIGGASAKTVVVNVAGPSLANYGIASPLQNPVVTLVRSSDQAIVATNDDWQTQTSPADVAGITASGFQPNHALEPAIIATLAPGAYTAIVHGANGGTGVALIGVFEVDHPDAPMINISTRGKVLSGEDVMIAGFIVEGGSSKKVVVNVAGPSLLNFGIQNSLQDPTLLLVRSSDNAVIAINDNWQYQPSPGDVIALAASGFQPNHPLEPAIIATLPPGAYTAIVRGVGGGTGVAVVGVFAVAGP